MRNQLGSVDYELGTMETVQVDAEALADVKLHHETEHA